jgi:hypothetical protein
LGGKKASSTPASGTPASSLNQSLLWILVGLIVYLWLNKPQ